MSGLTWSAENNIIWRNLQILVYIKVIKTYFRMFSTLTKNCATIIRFIGQDIFTFHNNKQTFFISDSGSRVEPQNIFAVFTIQNLRLFPQFSAFFLFASSVKLDEML